MTWPEKLIMLDRGKSPDGLPINPPRKRLRGVGCKAWAPVADGWYSYRHLVEDSSGQLRWKTYWFRDTKREA